MTVRSIPSPSVAVVTYTLRACLPAWRRGAVILVPLLGALLFGWLATVVDTPREDAFADIAQSGLFGLLLPLTCLIIGDAVLASDVRGGTFQLTWLSPVSFPMIALGRWLGGWLTAAVTLGPAFALAAVIAGQQEAIWPLILGAVAGAAAYIALFVMLAVLVRRSAMWALAVVFLVEALLGNAVSGVAQLTPGWQAQQAFAGLWDEGGWHILRPGMPEGWSAVARLVAITVVLLAVTTWRIAFMRPIPDDE